MNKMSENKKQTAIYARVSSQRQKEGDTIKSQLECLITLAKEQNYFINNNWIFLDDGVSGKTLQRPALDELRDLICFETIECLLIYSTDRLARNYSHQLILLEEFKKHGVKVIFLKNPPTADTPESIMLNHFQGIFAEYERALILDRSRRGKIYKAKQGNPVCLPAVAYGYKRVKTNQGVTIEVCEEQAKVVKNIFRLYVYEKKSISEIARLLTQEGIKTANNGSVWINSSIRHMLHNTSYIGTAYYGKTEESKGVTNRIRRYKSGKVLQPKHARKAVSEEKWLPILMPILINENDFEQAQQQLKINKELSSRNTKEPSLLQGLVTCGVCGNPFYKRSRKYKDKLRSYYYCKTQGDRKLKKCSNGCANQEDLDNLVFNETLKMLQNPSLVRAELSRRAKESSVKDDHISQENHCKKDLLKINKERDRLLDAFQSGLINLDELKKRYQETDKRRNDLEKELQRIQALSYENEKFKNLEDGFENILREIKVSEKNLSLKEKQKVVRLLIQQVIVSPENVKIIHCISPKMIMQEFCQLKANDPD